VPAFNVNNLEQVHAIMEAAAETDSPVIMQASAGARSYAGAPFLRHLMQAAVEQWPDIPICVHQDHGADPGVCLRSIQLGFTSVMMDGSLMPDMKTPSTYEYNVEVTRQVAEMAHAGGVSVEGELGCLGSLETGMAGEEDGSGADWPSPSAPPTAPTSSPVRPPATSSPSSASRRSTPASPTRIKEIHARIPDTHLVMHGSSSVPQDWLKIIHEYGGDIGETYGVPVEEIQQGIKYGVRKVNIDTDLRLAATGAIRKHLAENPKNFDPRKYFKAAKDAMKQICKDRYEAFGCAGMASKIKPISLEDMYKRYESGELDPKIN